MKFYRKIYDNIHKWIKTTSEIKVIYGARQVGKTFLVSELLKDYNKNEIIFLNGDLISDREGFDFTKGQSITKYIGNAKVLFIDEAQRFKNIGLNLKIIYDQKLPIQIIVTGSSSLDIASDINEPLTGRMISWILPPISIQEYILSTNFPSTQKNLHNFMIYGMYPDILLADNDIIQNKLDQLTSNYLYKDILEYSGIRKSDTIIKLLKLLALQIGSQVSYNELGQQLGLNYETVSNYISLLEQSFIIYQHHSRSTNARNEIKKSRKIYFWDMGIRNSLISNFLPLDLRNDIGAMRENFVIIERLKYIKNNGLHNNIYFWRDYQQAEIDLVEQFDDKIIGYEIKRNPNKKTKNIGAKIGANEFHIITPENFWDFVS